MKGIRLIILALSILLLTICSGLLYYKNLFQLESVNSGGKVNFEELRFTDLRINATTTMLRLNLSTDTTQLESEVVRLKELVNIVSDVRKSTLELNNSFNKINSYFDKKILNIIKFQIALAELKKAIDALNPTYNELLKNKIKFSIDNNRDFYRESLIDALFYISSPHRENERRLIEDKKILSQILSFANSPNPHILKFSVFVDIILKRGKEINLIIEDFNKDNSINNELVILEKYYKESIESKAHDGQIFLSMIFGAILLYIITIVLVLKKLT